MKMKGKVIQMFIKNKENSSQTEILLLYIESKCFRYHKNIPTYTHTDTII